jgi:hypothetical protein
MVVDDQHRSTHAPTVAEPQAAGVGAVPESVKRPSDGSGSALTAAVRRSRNPLTKPKGLGRIVEAMDEDMNEP